MFDRQFEVFLADTEESKRIHFHLRYHVYCLRKGYENPANFPDLLERDDYEDSSAHFIVRTRRSRSWVGAIRVIGPGDRLLPIFTNAVDTALLPTNSLARIAEASRLSVLPASTAGICQDVLRLGMQYNLSSCGPGGVDAFRNPWVALGLIRAARAYCLEHEIRYGFFLIADSLARVLRRIGMDIAPCGARCNHRGWRRPYIHDIVDGYREMEHRCPEIYQMFSRSPAYENFSEAMVERKPGWQTGGVEMQAP